ncbi:unnamed protein product, partial [Ixodes persulcatus]
MLLTLDDYDSLKLTCGRVDLEPMVCEAEDALTDEGGGVVLVACNKDRLKMHATTIDGVGGRNVGALLRLEVQGALQAGCGHQLARLHAPHHQVREAQEADECQPARLASQHRVLQERPGRCGQEKAGDLRDHVHRA